MRVLDAPHPHQHRYFQSLLLCCHRRIAPNMAYHCNSFIILGFPDLNQIQESLSCWSYWAAPACCCKKNKQKKGCRCAALRELFTRKRRVFTDAFLRSSPYPWVPSVSEAVWSQLLLLALTGRYFGICGFYFSCGVAVNRSFRVFSFFAFVSFLTVKESKCLFTHPFCTGNLGLSE